MENNIADFCITRLVNTAILFYKTNNIVDSND